MRAEFIDNLSHELRTALTTVRLLTETLARDLDGSELPPRIRDGIVKIDIETGHLVQMVNELLDLSRIEQGSAPLHLSQVDVGQLVRASVERLALFAERQGVTLRADVEDELPPVRGDEDRLGQLLINLLHNAVKFSDAGGAGALPGRGDDGESPPSGAGEGAGIPRPGGGPRFRGRFKSAKAAAGGA